jgi:hypothetical protein
VSEESACAEAWRAAFGTILHMVHGNGREAVWELVEPVGLRHVTGHLVSLVNMLGPATGAMKDDGTLTFALEVPAGASDAEIELFRSSLVQAAPLVASRQALGTASREELAGALPALVVLAAFMAQDYTGVEPEQFWTGLAGVADLSDVQSVAEFISSRRRGS